MTYAYLQNVTSGDLYAVQMDGEHRVTAAFGPLTWRDLDDHPAAYAAMMTDADNAWFNADDPAIRPGVFRLLSGAELDSRTAEARAARSQPAADPYRAQARRTLDCLTDDATIIQWCESWIDRECPRDPAAPGYRDPLLAACYAWSAYQDTAGKLRASR